MFQELCITQVAVVEDFLTVTAHQVIITTDHLAAVALAVAAELLHLLDNLLNLQALDLVIREVAAAAVALTLTQLTLEDLTELTVAQELLLFDI
jgi:hypothetical protein